MRFEARHRYFKRLASQLGNFVNVPHTLSMRHQQLQCYHRLDDSIFQPEELEVGPGETISSETIPELTLATHPNVYRYNYCYMNLRY